MNYHETQRQDRRYTSESDYAKTPILDPLKWITAVIYMTTWNNHPLAWKHKHFNIKGCSVMYMQVKDPCVQWIRSPGVNGSVKERIVWSHMSEHCFNVLGVFWPALWTHDGSELSSKESETHFQTVPPHLTVSNSHKSSSYSKSTTDALNKW